jgi:hypothetical protein
MSPMVVKGVCESYSISVQKDEDVQKNPYIVKVCV